MNRAACGSASLRTVLYATAVGLADLPVEAVWGYAASAAAPAAISWSRLGANVGQSAQAETAETRQDRSRMGIPSDSYGALPVKRNDLLSVTSILSVLLLALHISQDIVFGFDRAGLNHLVGVAILLLVVCGALLLRERRSGKVIMLLGGVMAVGMLPLHMRNGLRPEFLEKSGALLFIWTLYVLGVSGAFSVILAVQALLARRVAS